MVSQEPHSTASPFPRSYRHGATTLLVMYGPRSNALCSLSLLSACFVYLRRPGTT